MKLETSSLTSLTPAQIQHIHQGLRYDLQRRIGSLSEVDDALQESWMALLGTRPGEVDNVRRWLYCVALRIAGRHRRGQSRRRHREEAVAARDLTPGTDELVADRQEQRHLTREVHRLPEPYKTVLTLYHYDDLSVERIASRLACPTGTVKSQLSRGRVLLRERLNRRTGVPALLLALFERIRRSLGPGRVALGAGSAAALLALPALLADGERREQPPEQAQLVPPTTLPARLELERSPGGARLTAPAALGSLEVSCVDERGTPLPEISVRLQALENKDAVRVLQSDVTGHILLEDLTPGAWRLDPDRGEGQLVEVKAQELTRIELVIASTPRLAGRVVEAPGDVPIEGATLFWILPGETYGERTTGKRTGPGGRFSLLGIDEAAWVAARAPDGRWTPFVRQDRGGETTLLLPRPDPGPRCRVVDPTGHPIEGARARLRVAESEVYSRGGLLERRELLFDGETDHAGLLDFPRFGLARLLRVEAPGFLPEQRELLGAGGLGAHLEIVLRPDTGALATVDEYLQGRLLNERGLPVPGRPVLVRDLPSRDSAAWLLGFETEPRLTHTDEAGRFRVRIGETPLLLETRPAATERPERRRVEPGTRELEWTLAGNSREGRVVGRLETARPDLYHLFLVREDRGFRTGLELDASGTFASPAVAAGTYELLAFSACLPLTSVARLRLRGDEVLDLGSVSLGTRSDLVIQLGTSDGRRLETVGARWSAAPVRRARLVKSRDGRFDEETQTLRVPSLAPGLYMIELDHPEYARHRTVVALGGEPEHRLEVQLRSGRERVMRFVPSSPLPEEEDLLRVVLRGAAESPEGQGGFREVHRVSVTPTAEGSPILLRTVLPLEPIDVRATTPNGWSFAGRIEPEPDQTVLELTLAPPAAGRSEGQESALAGR